MRGCPPQLRLSAPTRRHQRARDEPAPPKSHAGRGTLGPKSSSRQSTPSPVNGQEVQGRCTARMTSHGQVLASKGSHESAARRAREERSSSRRPCRGPSAAKASAESRPGGYWTALQLKHQPALLTELLDWRAPRHIHLPEYPPPEPFPPACLLLLALISATTRSPISDVVTPFCFLSSRRSFVKFPA